jgi:hypothetical protein
MTPEEKENVWRKHEATPSRDERKNIFQLNEERRHRAVATDEPEEEKEKRNE